MAEAITQRTDVPVLEFLNTVEPERRRLEGHQLHTLMSEVTGDPGVMWGANIVGYGLYSYHYASGRSGEWMKVGFSPRKAKLSLYGLQDHADAEALLEQLGPHQRAVSCVYVTRLDAVDDAVLRRLVALGMERGDYHA